MERLTDVRDRVRPDRFALLGATTGWREPKVEVFKAWLLEQAEREVDYCARRWAEA